MNIFQGKPIDSVIEKLDCISEINKFYFSESINPYEANLKEKFDEILNLLKLKEYLMNRNFFSFNLKVADSSYYNWTLGERKEFL